MTNDERIPITKAHIEYSALASKTIVNKTMTGAITQVEPTGLEIITFFMFNPTEHDIYHAHNVKMPKTIFGIKQ